MACLIAACRRGLDHLDQPSADDIDRSCQQFLQPLAGQIVPLTDLERQYAVLAGALDQRRISAIGKMRPRIAGGAPDHIAVATAHQHIGETARERRPLRHGQQMTLALDARDLDQRRFVEHGRAAQQRAGNRDFILPRQLPDQRARRVGDQRHSFGEFDPRGKFGMRNEIDQQPVEQIDVIGFEPCGILEEQLGDPLRGLGKAVRIAMPDDLIEPRNQRRGGCHQHTQKPARRLMVLYEVRNTSLSAI